ncbi:hydrogenase expression/formation protein HupK [Salipiger thiooxidans]|uniref:hydrogenase expression/formation protein HupK n=1 Tax=Salipiger thiooxidans TaxID=282683 RepID=UPI001A8CEAA8|nr:hydrogenase expression/formation protein HupK [Salipiger thiooxidans]MBN8185410.1 hydrogenase expression/formation protein HupK [Salipiger thiooxidans]
MLDMRPRTRLIAQPATPHPMAHLLLGKPVAEAEGLLQRLFNLCRGAQAAAVSAALGCRGAETAAAICEDSLRDHLLKFFITWPGLLDLPQQPLQVGWRAGGDVLLGQLFGPEAVAPQTPDAFAAFLAGDNPLAAPLARIAALFAPGEAVSGVLPGVRFDTIWARGAQENSVAARHAAHPVMRHIEASHGRGPLWRATARLYDIAAVARGILPAIEARDARALVPAARGAYAIHIVAEDGRVTAFDRVTPTDALLAEGGILARSLATLPEEKTGLGALLLDILDPCSPVSLTEVRDA